MPEEKRACWCNCAQPADDEIRSIDRMEDRLGPLTGRAKKIRALITGLELCHHKADRWVQNILDAIAEGQTDKGLLTRPAGQQHPAEQVWSDAGSVLEAWLAGDEPPVPSVGPVSSADLLARLKEPTPLRRWQVARAAERIHSFAVWAETGDYSAVRYVPILEAGEGYVSAPRSSCPEQYEQHVDHWRASVETLIHDTSDGEPATMALGMAIDLLMPCHYNFVQNLQLVLGAIGGDLRPARPYTACGGRNMALSPLVQPMKEVCDSLRAFCGGEETALLGESTDEKVWLAASLDKTIRLQLGL